MSDYAQRIFDALKDVTTPTDHYYWDDEDDRPEPGTSISMGSGYSYNRYAAKDSMPDLIRVPGTSWGDYAGSGVDRANCTALFEDFPHFFVEAGGGWDSHELLMPTYWQPDDEDETPDESLTMVLDIIVGMVTDYPLYRDESLSELEMEEAGKAWGDYLQWDVPRSLREAGVPDECLDALSDEELQGLWWDAEREANESAYLESATSIVFPQYEDNIERMVPVVVENGYRSLLAQATGHGAVKWARDQRKAYRNKH